MTDAGMTTRLDAVGNLIGSYPTPAAIGSPAKVLLVGSHLDTVINAGRYDGPLGVLLGLAAVELIRDIGFARSFAIDVIGFCEEEGIRYRTPFIGSRWLIGAFETQLFEQVDERGVSMRLALQEFFGEAVDSATPYDPDRVLGFIEPHIEQGPVLDREGLPIGVVDSIAGQTRATIRFTGGSGHAGTVPMSLRRDAMAGAAEWITRIETLGRRRSEAVATVGRIEVTPNVSNVIPSEAKLSLDVRHDVDEVRNELIVELLHEGEAIARRRGLSFAIDAQEQIPAVAMDETISALLAEGAAESGVEIRRLTSGAGHDAGVMARKFPTAMLFVRCREGISHQPDESVRVEDVAIALEVLVRVIYKLASENGRQ